MININLLPESMRRREGLPRQQLLGLVVCVLVAGLILSAILRYTFVVIPGLSDQKKTLANQKKQLELQVDELRKINQEIDRMSGYVNAVQGLYRQRTVWTKILSDIKHIVNFDATMSEYNADQRYLWLVNLNGKENDLSLTGYATASSQVVAMQMPERIIQGMMEFTPASAPEKEEEAKLEKALSIAINAHELERRDNPNLPLQGKDELNIRARLEEIKAVKSGGIALMPFREMLVPGSLQLKSASWGPAPRPRSNNPEDEHMFPTNAWNFTIEMKLR